MVRSFEKLLGFDFGVRRRSALAFCCCVSLLGAAAGTNELMSARDRQDGVALERLVKQYQQAAQGSSSADANYELALAYSYSAEVAMEVRDKKKAEAMAEAGLDPAKKAIQFWER